MPSCLRPSGFWSVRFCTPPESCCFWGSGDGLRSSSRLLPRRSSTLRLFLGSGWFCRDAFGALVSYGRGWAWGHRWGDSWADGDVGHCASSSVHVFTPYYRRAIDVDRDLCRGHLRWCHHRHYRSHSWGPRQHDDASRWSRDGKSRSHRRSARACDVQLVRRWHRWRDRPRAVRS